MKLTLKQRKWLKLYLELGNATEAAVQSYDCKDRESAAQIGYENLRKLDYADFLEQAGVTDELLIKKTAEGLEAVSAVGKIPDFTTRLKYLELAYKLKNRFIIRKDITSGDNPLPIPIYSGKSMEDK